MDRGALPEQHSNLGVTQSEVAAMQLALELAGNPAAPHGPNPRVGCVILASGGEEIARGWHLGAGTPHAEVAAISAAKAAGRAADLRGATAVVTLEPCNHTGRTGPCSQALIDSGLARVIYAQSDPNPIAAGGSERLRSAGVEVVAGVLEAPARNLNLEWSFAMERGRPFVTWKVAATLDGRVAAADGSSRWITSAGARQRVHQLRAQVQAVMVGTGTALADDPSLTVRDADGQPVGRQPLRVVVGRRSLPVAAKLRDGAAQLVQYPGDDLDHVLHDLAEREVCHVLLEGGPQLAASMLAAGMIDRVLWFTAPVLLGAGPAAVGDLGIATISAARRFEVVSVEVLAPDLLIELVPNALGS